MPGQAMTKGFYRMYGVRCARSLFPPPKVQGKVHMLQFNCNAGGPSSRAHKIIGFEYIHKQRDCKGWVMPARMCTDVEDVALTSGMGSHATWLGTGFAPQ